MALHYILDGYNIVKQVPALDLKKLQSGREGLSTLVELYRPQGSLKNTVTIVFDGSPDVIGDLNPKSSPKVIFSSNESADDKIRKIVEASSRKKEIIVVTDDRELQFSVRLLGAQVMAVKDFLAKASPRGMTHTDRQAKQGLLVEEKHISKTLEYKITSEFEKIWLKKK